MLQKKNSVSVKSIYPSGIILLSVIATLYTADTFSITKYIIACSSSNNYVTSNNIMNTISVTYLIATPTSGVAPKILTGTKITLKIKTAGNHTDYLQSIIIICTTQPKFFLLYGDYA